MLHEIQILNFKFLIFSTNQIVLTKTKTTNEKKQDYSDWLKIQLYMYRYSKFGISNSWNHAVRNYIVFKLFILLKEVVHVWKKFCKIQVHKNQISPSELISTYFREVIYERKKDFTLIQFSSRVKKNYTFLKLGMTPNLKFLFLNEYVLLSANIPFLGHSNPLRF